MTTNSLHLVTDLHDKHGNLIAPYGTPVEIIDDPDTIDALPHGENLTTFRPFDRPTTYYVISIPGHQEGFAVHADQIG
jgi:hypothetical protein